MDPLILFTGFGAVIMTLFLVNLKDKSSLSVFISSMIVGGIFEYLCSWIQEIFVGTISWDYAANQISIGGRTSLVYMVFWGVLGLTLLKVLLPLIINLIDKVPVKSGTVFIYLIIIFIVFSMGISALAVRRQVDRNLGIPATNSIEEFIDENYTDEFLKKVYPNMKVPDRIKNK